jgi:hypothetical protein
MDNLFTIINLLIMTSISLTEQEKADLIQGLSASIHRLNNKIKNDERNNRDFTRIAWRKEKIGRAKVLIEKMQKYEHLAL